MRSFLFAVVGLLLLLMGCQLFDNNKAASPHYYEEIYVPLFAGDPICRKECTNYFVLKLSSEIDSWVIKGDYLQRSEAEELGSAKGRGAAILILGYIHVDDDSPYYNGSATISVYDVETRKLLKEFHHPCAGGTIPSSNCDYVNCSIEYITRDLGNYLKFRD